MRIEERAAVETAPRLVKMETSVKSVSAANRQPVQPYQDLVDLSGEAMTMIKDERRLLAERPVAGDVQKQVWEDSEQQRRDGR